MNRIIGAVSIFLCVIVIQYKVSASSTGHLSLRRPSVDRRLLLLRGGAKKKSRRSLMGNDESEDTFGDKESDVDSGYKPKAGGLASSIVTLLFRLLISIVGPFLPESLLVKANKKKKSIVLAGKLQSKRLNSETSNAKASTGKKGAAIMTQEHLEKGFTKGNSNKRVQKELRSFLANPPENCKLRVGANIRIWVVQITGAEGTVFAGEKYKLKIVFPKDYPAKPPGVYFLKPTPRHVHVYSNGDICLNLLGKDWRPTMSAQLLVVSIYSMLGSAKQKGMPQDNAMHADNAPGQFQEGWMYHDDRC